MPSNTEVKLSAYEEILIRLQEIQDQVEKDQNLFFRIGKEVLTKEWAYLFNDVIADFNGVLSSLKELKKDLQEWENYI
jgi:hypothetical protein